MPQLLAGEPLHHLWLDHGISVPLLGVRKQLSRRWLEGRRATEDLLQQAVF